MSVLSDRSQGELHLEEVRSIIERINSRHHTEFGEVEVLESGKAVAVLTESEGLEELVESNDIDEIVGTESKPRLLEALPELEERGQEFWTAVRQDPEVFTMLAEDLLREACENLKAKRKNRATNSAGVARTAAPAVENP